MKKVLLYSGGMDSWLIDKLWKPDLKLYVDMKTKYSEMELQRLRETNVDMQVIEFPLGQWERDDAIIPLRNMYLAMVACNYTGSEDVEICLGATAGDRSLDQSIEFTNKASELLNYLYMPQHWIPNGRKVNICMRYKDYSKTDLLREYIKQGGDIETAFKQSLSCYNPTNGCECWECKPCRRKFLSFKLNGYKFDDEINRRVLDYLTKEIEPQILAGTYGRGKEDQEILDVIKMLREE